MSQGARGLSRTRVGVTAVELDSVKARVGVAKICMRRTFGSVALRGREGLVADVEAVVFFQVG